LTPNDPWLAPAAPDPIPAVRYFWPVLTLVTRILLTAGGSLVTLAGVIFTLQGVGVIGGSFMSGTTTWAVAGPLIALAGLALVALGLRRRPGAVRP
jgi:hypothetical protein